ncbi:MAG: DUF58 domain-containing protein, partial [Bacillota bacterium]|nr:DUF58 domain-containing protein [Bacillota bacterium]
YKRQQIILVQVLSEGELFPEIGGQVRLLDSETREEINLTVTPKLLKIYSAKLAAQFGSIKASSTKYGGTFIQVSTSEALEKLIFEYFAREGII